MSKRVVIVGGGVIGTACSYYLRQAGYHVTLIDQGRVGGACSHGNCGYVSPSHALPLAGPGMIVEGLKTLFQKEAPLAIRWRWNPALWAWLWRFARRCHPRAMWESARALNALLTSSRRLYDQLFETTPLDAEWDPRGLLFVFRTEAKMEHYAEVDRSLRSMLGLGAERIDGRDLSQFEPALVDSLAGAWNYRTDAQLRPDRLMAGWRQLIQAIGVDIREQCSLRDIPSKGRRAIAVRTSGGDFSADHVVVAAGAWTPLLHRALGMRLPIQPGKGYSMTMARPANCPRWPMIFEEHRVAVTPFQSCFRIGSTMEFAGYDPTLNRRRLQMIRNGAAIYLQTPTAEPVFEEWWGWRPMVPDGKPIIGFTTRHDNVIVAAGHGMLGLTMATGTGKLVAELISESSPHVDPRPFRPDRFRSKT